MHEEDELLVRRMAQNDEGALAELYDRYAGRIFSVAYHICGQNEAAEEVVQDVFLTVWREARQYDAARGSLRTWMFAMARNRSIDFLRRQSAKPSVSFPHDSWLLNAASEDEDVARQAENALLWEEASKQLALMPAQYRQPLMLAYFGGLSHREIAEVLHIPLGTVKTRMRVALDRLRQSMHFSETRPREET